MKEIFDFIDTTKINTLDALQLKCMIEDVRSKAIEEFAEALKSYKYGRTNGVYIEIPLYRLEEIAEQLKTNTER